MKTISTLIVAGLVGFFLTLATSVHADDPRTNSWLSTYTAKYARIYTNDAMKTAGTSLTMWSNGSQTQSSPAYCGVQEVYSSANWVYIRSTGLGAHVMGPWQNGAFPNLPVNTKSFYRIPRTNAVPTTKTLTGLGAIGYFVDGVAMFDSRDGFVWTGSSESGSGTGYWNREAYKNEGATFDPGYAHQEQTGTHHYHANPIALRYLLGDHVDYDATAKTYSESTNTATKHSPILGWVRDGYPVYGPYGYSVSNNAASGVRRMISGFVLRNGQNGSQNLTVVGRTNIPPWAVRLYGVSANQTCTNVNASYPLGRYMEDYDFLGDLGYTQGTNTFDLDEYNGRFCVTPEFPGGTYAYFVAIETNGTPKFPNNIGRAFRGDPVGGSITGLTETVTTNFLGGPNSTPLLNSPTVKNGAVTLTWSATEGGTYMVLSTTNLSTWTTNSTTVAAVLNAASYTNNPTDQYRFYRVARTALASYDPVSTTTSVAPGGSASHGATVTVTITLPSSPPQPPADKVPTSVTLAGSSIAGTSISRPSTGTVLATFAIPSGATAGTTNIIVTFNPAPTYTMTNSFTISP